MARDRSERPTTDDELEALRADLEELQDETAAALAEDLGGEPADYRPGQERVADGGEDRRGGPAEFPFFHRPHSVATG